jgi:two-component system chemotaxis response regulator CheB
MEFVGVDHVLPLQEIPVLLAGLVRERAVALGRRNDPLVHAMEPDLGEPELALDEQDRPGRVSVFTCPECHGTLWEAEEKGILRFRCRVGHVYSPDSMLAAQTDSVDRALWAALRSLEERAALTQKMADRARLRQHAWVARAFEERSKASAEHAAVVRDLLQHRTSAHVVPDHADEPEIPDPTDDTSLEATGDETRR